MLATVAQVAGEVLTRCRGEVKEVVGFLGGKLLAPRTDEDRMRDFFGKRHGFPDVARLEQIARVGVPVDVGPGGGLRVILIGELFSHNFDIFFAQFFNLPYFPDFFSQLRDI